MNMNFINTGADEALVKSLGLPTSPNQVFTNAVCAAVLFNNDLHHIHLHAAGYQFDRIHRVTEDYYYTAGDHLDTLAELALEYHQAVPNFTKAGNILPWNPSQQEAYDWAGAVKEMSSGMSSFLAVLNALRNQPELQPDAQSKLDDIIRYWNKELSYKMERRTETPT